MMMRLVPYAFLSLMLLYLLSIEEFGASIVMLCP
jgi:hypothetical protein